jgi:hypothetical protein
VTDEAAAMRNALAFALVVAILALGALLMFL